MTSFPKPAKAKTEEVTTRMNRSTLLPTILLLALPTILTAADPAEPGMVAAASPPSTNPVDYPGLQAFLGAPVSLPLQQLWKGRGGTSIVTARDGTVVAFQSMASNKIRRSSDGGRTWDEDLEIGPGATYANAVVDETSGDLLYVNPAQQWLWRSRDHGLTWARETITVRPDGFGLVPNTVSSMQPGITLQFGPHPGRLLMPARIQGPEYSNDVEWRPYHYSTAVYSDDGGTNWQTSHPFPVLGTGEAALAELSNGRILYNSREHMSRGNRFLAWSHDGGALWLDAHRSPELPDGPRGSSYGCMGGMLRLPVEGLDILLYSNLDTEAGRMPEQVGASITKERQNIPAWASFDGGQTWPVKRLVFGGPAGYSNLAAGRAGTPSDGRIYLLFEGGPGGRRSGIQVAVFNLSWLLNGRELADLGIQRSGPQG